MQLLLRGEQVDFFPISTVANAVGRSTGTVRRWIALGLLPDAEYRAPGRAPNGQKRLWRREAVLRIVDVAQELGLQERRPHRRQGSHLSDRLHTAARR